MVIYDVPELDVPVYPIVFMPKRATTDASIPTGPMRKVTLVTHDEHGNACHYYTGPMMVKVVDRPRMTSPMPADEATFEAYCPEETASLWSIGDIHDIDQMPVILAESSVQPFPSYSQSQVWIDPSRSPYVYNNYETPSNNPTYEFTQSINKTGNCIMVQNNHYTSITQNVINNHPGQQLNSFEPSRPRRKQRIQPVYEELDDYYDDSESDQYLSELVSRKKKRIAPRRKAAIKDKNEEKALKQLMSTESTCKQRRTILFDVTDGKTIQNIAYTDPMIKCSEIDVDHEVTIEESPSLDQKKKKFQCDKCKQIFDQISTFHQHMNGKHTSSKTKEKKVSLRCNQCGRNFKIYQKYQKHCLGHGDPDVECPKCHKVYSSNATLKVHMKIHDRKFPCSYCTKTYATAQTYKTHMKKSHLKYLCKYDDCSFVANSDTVLNDHHDDHVYDQDQIVRDQLVRDQIARDQIVQDQIVRDQIARDQIAQDQNVENQKDQDTSQYDDQEDFQVQNIQISKIAYEEEVNNSAEDEETRDINDYINDIELDQIDKSNDSDLAEAFPDDFSDVDFEDESDLIDPVKNEMDFSNVRGAEEGQRIKEADSVIAKVMSSKIFLLNSKNAKKHAKKSRKNKTCTICSKSFDRVTDLKRHLIEHVVKSTLAKTVSSAQGFLDILCEICQEESFESVDKYKAHLREHAHLTTYKCTQCDKSFSDSSNFSKHKKIHGACDYQCDLCSRKFNSKAMLSRHIEYHEKNKPLKCRHCTRYFYFESMLNKHVRTAHRLTASSFRCKFCDAVMKSLKEKWDHEWVVHNIRKSANDCQYCEARFRKYSELKRHCVVIHNVELKKSSKNRRGRDY